MAGPLIQQGHNQSLRRHAFCQIIIDGQDVTNRFDPYLISVQVVDNLNEEDRCNIELDDREAKLAIPEDDAAVLVKLGWQGQGPRIPLFRQHEVDDNGHILGYDFDVLPTEVPPGELPFEAAGLLTVFNGWVHNCESGFSRRSGGRRLWLEARGTRGKANDKSPLMQSWGAGNEAVGTEVQGGDTGGGIPLSQVLGDAAGKAGLGLSIAPSLGNISRSFWFQNESFRHFAQRIAKEVGGQLKISGGQAILTSATDGLNVDGKNMPLLMAEWGTNLISWRIKPYVARPQYADAKSTFFKIFDGQWDNVKKAIGGSAPFGKASATTMIPGAAPNKRVGDQYNGGMSAESELRRGTGWCLINGEPVARAGAYLKIIGARPGVDGSYKIKTAEHNYVRAAGYTTRCDLDKPEFLSGYEHFKKAAGSAAT